MENKEYNAIILDSLDQMNENKKNTFIIQSS